MRSRGPTITDIAGRLGVSLSTVNKALTGKKGVGEARRQEILRTAEEMGYTVNYAAQSLSRKHLRIGVLIPGIWRHYFGLMEDGMRKAFRELEGSGAEGIIMHITDAASAAEAAEQLLDSAVDGMIWCSSGIMPEPALCDRIRMAGIPVFLAGDRCDALDSVASVRTDACLTGRMCADLMGLLLPGGGDTVVFAGSLDIPAHADKVRCYRESAERAGIRTVRIYETHDDASETASCVARMVREYGRPDGLYIATATAEPLLDYLGDLPQRPRVVGTDVYDSVREALAQRRLDALLFQNQMRIGRLAVRMAYRRLVEARSYRPEGGKAAWEVLLQPQLLLASNAESFDPEETDGLL